MIKYIVGFLVACAMWIIILNNVTVPEYRIYDCGMAEWHPDIPNEVRQECRKRKYLEPRIEIEEKIQRSIHEDSENFCRSKSCT